MRVSFIIPAINEAGNIATAVGRARAAGADEVIVVDGGSSDQTCEAAAATDCLLLESPPGRAKQQNLGAQHATGDVLCFQHADNWLVEGGVDQIREVMRDSSVTCGAFWQRIEASGARYRWLEWGNAWRVRWTGAAYGDQGIFARRTAFEQVGGFPEVRLMEDLLLMQALRKQSWPRLLEGPVHISARRWQQHGVVRQTLRNWLLLTAHAMGVSPDRLANFYPRHDAKKKANGEQTQQPER